MIDYRALLKTYMAHIMSEEGITFLTDEYDQKTMYGDEYRRAFSREENGELVKIWDELAPQGSWGSK